MYNCPTQPLTRFLKYSISAMLSLFLCTEVIQAQTDFAPGEIMFTGFDSDDPDGFSFVLLAPVVSTTTIYITDRGWDNSTGDGFRDDPTLEGTISFLFGADYLCGTEFFFSKNTTPNPDVWEARDADGILVGTVTTLTATGESPSQDPNGPGLGCTGGGCPDGDQLFIYQTPEPTPASQGSFVTAIHYNGTNWDNNNDFEYTSEKPTALSDVQVVRFSAELDNAKYGCLPRSGPASDLRAAISNYDGTGGNLSNTLNRWTEGDANINLNVPCDFCCGSLPETPVISAPGGVSTNQVFTIDIAGTLAPGETWELYTAGCGVGAPLQTTTSSNFTVTAPSTEGTITYYVRTS
jgi:hypothetical protein